MLDEPSLGLAPSVVEQIFDAVRHLADDRGPVGAAARAERGPGAAHHRPGLRHAFGPGASSRRPPSRCAPGDRTADSSDAANDAPPSRCVPRRTGPPRAHRRPSTTTDCPRVVPIWFIRQGDDLPVHAARAGGVPRQLRRDPRIGLSIDEDPLPYRKVTVRGTRPHRARPGDDDEWRDLYRSIAKRYVPADAADAYVDATIDQPRALIAVPLAGRQPRSTHWRMPSATRTAPASGTGATTSTAPTWPGRRWHRRAWLVPEP